MNKKRGRPFLVTPNSVLKAALAANDIPDDAIKSACLIAADYIFTSGNSDSPDLIESLLRRVDEISVDGLQPYCSYRVSKRYLQRLMARCRKAAGILTAEFNL
nr:hypothetical protein [Escherichia coli]